MNLNIGRLILMFLGSYFLGVITMLVVVNSTAEQYKLELWTAMLRDLPQCVTTE